jgi:hypothetical protein
VYHGAHIVACHAVWVSSNVRLSANRTHVASLRTTTPPGCHDMMLREYQDVVAMEPKNVVMHRSKVSMPHSLNAAQYATHSNDELQP